MKTINALQAAVAAMLILAIPASSETLKETYSSKVASGNSVTGNSLTATFVYDGYSGASGGIQMGSGNNPATSATITVTPVTSSDKAIRSVWIETKGAKGINANVAATINGSAGSAQSLTTSFQNLEFPASQPSEPFEDAVFTFANSSAAALYVRSISVELNESPEVVAAPDAITAQVGTEVTVDLSEVFSDSDDPGGLSYEIVAGCGDITDGVWAWTPDREESVNITISARDPYDATAQVSFTASSTLDAVAPNVILSAQYATTVIGAGAVEMSVSADSDDAVLSMWAPPEAESGTLEFNPETGAFSFIPAATGTYEFTFTAAHPDDGTLSTSAQFVVEVGLAAPENLVAESSASSISATWSAVSGATAYAVSLAPASVEISFDDSLGNGTSYVAKEGAAAEPNSLVQWSSAEARGDKNIKDTRSLTVKTGSTLEIGPLPHGVSSVSFKYAQTNTKAGSVDVSVVSTDGAPLATLGATITTGGGEDQGVSHDWSESASVSEACKVVISVSKNPISFDEISILPNLQSYVEQTDGDLACEFTGLPQTAAYALSVSATDGSAVSPAATTFVETAGNHAPSISVDSASVSTTVGANVRLEISMYDPDNDELTWEVSPEGTGADIINDPDTGRTLFVFSPNSVGTTEFTIVGTDPYGASASASFSVSAALANPENLRFSNTDCRSTVLSWDPVPGANGYRIDASYVKARGASVISETFDKFANLSASGSADANADTYTDNPGWTLKFAYRGDNGSATESGESRTSVKFGTGSYAGSITSPALDLSGNGGSFTVAFDARRWVGDATTLAVVVNGVTNDTDVVIGDKMEAKVVSCTGGTSETTVQITAKKPGNNRFFLDNLQIVSGSVEARAVMTGEEVQDTSVAIGSLRPDARCSFTVTAYAALNEDEEVTSSANAELRTPEAPSGTVFLMREKKPENE